MGRLQAPLPVLDDELHERAGRHEPFVEFEIVDVHEHVLTPGVGGNETISAELVEPHNPPSDRHSSSPSIDTARHHHNSSSFRGRYRARADEHNPRLQRIAAPGFSAEYQGDRK